jgi:hypothetical protein
MANQSRGEPSRAIWRSLRRQNSSRPGGGGSPSQRASSRAAAAPAVFSPIDIVIS